MSDVLQEITAIRNDAFYTSQAQKLDMLFKKQNQNPNTQLRWIWELIQNAKDAPNKFMKVKIKQSLSDKYFVSSHNGDAFSLKELHSLATQYSTKSQINNQDTKTTGKYGTGFLTTHIISQKVTIQSILKFKRLQQKGSENEQEKEKKSKQKEKIICDEVRQKEQGNRYQEDLKINEQQSKDIENNNFFYLQFDDLVLDRSYEDRDKELPKKIKKAENKISELGNKAKFSTQYGVNKNLIDYYENKRDVDCYDTHFKYEIYDQEKFSIIEKALQNVRDLISFAFLFNPNLEYYQFIDQRVNDKNLSFSIKRKQLTKIIKDISIFKYQISQKYCSVTKQFKDFSFGNILVKIHNGNILAGIPIEIDGDNWKILKIDKKLPQIFKDFPLIGSQPIKWNAVINSNQFYPDEQRSHLLLKSNDSTNLSRIHANQLNLISCFEGIKNLYIYLAQYECSGGLQCLLIMDPDNCFSTVNNNLKSNLLKLVNEIKDKNFIPSKKGIGIGREALMSKIKQLSFIQSQNKNLSQRQRIKFSFQLNQSFAFLYPKNILLAQDIYKQFFYVLDKLDGSNFKPIQQNQYIFLSDCLQKLEFLGYKKFQQMYGQNSLPKLHLIYKLLTKYKLPIWSHEIFLNENLDFVEFQQGTMMKKEITQNQQKLLEWLDIDYKDTLIHNEFIEYFTEKLKDHEFTSVNMQTLIHQNFPTINMADYTADKQKYQQKLKQLYQLLITFQKLPTQTIEKLQLLVMFNDLEQIDLPNENSSQQELTQECIKNLLAKFAFYFATYLYDLIIQSSTLERLFLKIIYDEQATDSQQFFSELLKDQILGARICQIPIKLTMDQYFVPQSNLNKLAQEIQLPNGMDIQFYNILNINNQVSIRKRLVLDIYPYEALKKITPITYKSLYQKVLQNNYTKLSSERKQNVLDYARMIQRNFKKTTCVDKTDAEKYNAWQQFLQKKHQKIFQVKKTHSAFEKEQVKQFFYEICDDPKLLESQAENYFKRKRQQALQNENNKLASKPKPIKKVKIQ